MYNRNVLLMLQTEFLQTAGWVYLNCCFTRSTLVWQSRHWHYRQVLCSSSVWTGYVLTTGLVIWVTDPISIVVSSLPNENITLKASYDNHTNSYLESDLHLSERKVEILFSHISIHLVRQEVLDIDSRTEVCVNPEYSLVMCLRQHAVALSMSLMTGLDCCSINL